MAADALAIELPAQRGGAKALLLTVLGEFVLPTGGSAWTATLVAAAEALGIGEKNARQALARIGDQGLIAGERHGRNVRWTLTPAGRRLLESGADRIYEFGATVTEWDGEWLVAHCPVGESQRAQRQQLRTRLGFLGFGELSPSLFVSPHVDREPQMRAVLAELGLVDETIVLRSAALSADADVVSRAWDLDELATAYRAFTQVYGDRVAEGPADVFRADVELVHDWRRFPFIDPEVPARLLPNEWAGTRAAVVFRRRHADWSPVAREWFADRGPGESTGLTSPARLRADSASTE